MASYASFKITYWKANNILIINLLPLWKLHNLSNSAALHSPISMLQSMTLIYFFCQASYSALHPLFPNLSLPIVPEECKARRVDKSVVLRAPLCVFPDLVARVEARPRRNGKPGHIRLDSYPFAPHVFHSQREQVLREFKFNQRQVKWC